MNSRPPRVVLLYSSFAYLVDNASAQVLYQDLYLVPKFAKVHGILMGLAFVIVLPLGALLIRTLKFKGAIWVHVACQLVGWALMLAGLAKGIRVGKIIDRLHNNAHTILGTIVVVLLLLQPFIGFIHHRRFLATEKRGLWTHLHVWYGRLLIVLGIINGGLGLKLAGNTMAGNIVYGVLGALVGVLYLLGIGVFEGKILKRGRHEKTSPNDAMEERHEP